MKVALLGNMNNILFALARYLRDEGFDVTLFLFENEAEHFKPHNDVFDGFEQPDFVRSLSWGDPARYSAVSARTIADDLRPFDFLIGCGPAPAFVAKANRCLDVFVPYGGDLFRLPFPTPIHLARMPFSLSMVAAQRKAIASCGHVLLGITNPAFEARIAPHQLGSRRLYYTPPMLYHKEYTPEILQQQWPNHPHYAQLDALRQMNDLLIIHHSRHYWKWRGDKWSMKGNDRVVHGFKDYVRANPSVRAHLVLMRYGKDVRATERLVHSLGIADHVTWLPLLPRKWVMTALGAADAAIGELYRSWLTYGVACETLCAAKPLIHHRADETYTEYQPELYPMIHAHDKDGVVKALTQVHQHPDAAAETGRAGYEWLTEYAVRRPVTLVHDLIHAAS